MICLFLIGLIATASGEMGSNDYVEYTAGTLPIIISAPHGGGLKPASIDDRKDGCLVSGSCNWDKTCSPKSSSCDAKTSKDSFTNELAHEISDELFALTGERPHLVENHLHRSKLDMNREINEAAQGDAAAITAHADYESFLNTARTAVGTGLLLDIHGQTHTEGWTELGYLVIKSRLDGENGKSPLAKYSSIKSLDASSSATFEELLRGATSLGARLQASGLDTIPSPTNPTTGGGNYYTGGYITRYFGSRYSGNVDAIQVEVHSSIRFNATQRLVFANKLASGLETYFSDHYGVTL